MWRRTMMVVLILGGALALVACEVQFNFGDEPAQTLLPTLAATAPPMLTPTPTTTPGEPVTETIVEGAVRLYCQIDCQKEEVYPFHDINVYTDYETALTEIGEEGRVALAWFPQSQPVINGPSVDGMLYFAQTPNNEQAPPNYEFWREFLIAIRSYLSPITSDEPPTANLKVIEGPLQNVTAINLFPAGEDGEETIANLITAMKVQEGTAEDQAADPFDDVTQAQFLVRRAGAPDLLVILVEQTEQPDSPRYCFEGSSWFTWLFHCASFW